ncbi:Vta1p Ecym_1064 [Eremothecium cymbalariae DBVPG|uniref:Vta1 C-terminal domain-containing protein n=1 Tax=Eremothecium cymbalariae (strain CBS 270.75 / DBVPG 7215 / KCTC 17166 / NRRL Y-17582) TaxID=931890 RepID=G8JMB3_ERECY|nr:hypothetical protein Ecym_1064 [Eremothecium cymbalariae DBVPG\
MGKSKNTAGIARLQRWCNDLERAMPIVAYYMKLYTVEKILSERGEQEVRSVAAQLLDQVELFKREAVGEAAVLALIEDQQKAKTVVLNFALKMHNGILEKLSLLGHTEDVRTGLWCSMDLLQCILHLWSHDEDVLSEQERAECQRRVKHVKYTLARGKPEAPLAPLAPEVADDQGPPVFVDEEQPMSSSPSSSPAAAAAAPNMQAVLDQEQKISQVQKLAKYAISALNYDDIPTAKAELQAALALLNTL